MKNVQFQRRHFEFLANAIYHGDYTPSERGKFANDLAWWLRQTNPQFDTEKFVEAALLGKKGGR